MTRPVVGFILKDGGKLPMYDLGGDTGMDIRAIYNGIIMPHERMKVDTGVYLAYLEDNQYIRIAPRSKLAYKHGINVLGGVVEHTYRGQLGVLLHNTDPYKAFSFKAGDAIAQLIPTDITESESVEYFVAEETTRGSEGLYSEEERRCGRQKTSTK